jgi:hypothetical protein
MHFVCSDWLTKFRQLRYEHHANLCMFGISVISNTNIVAV